MILIDIQNVNVIITGSYYFNLDAIVKGLHRVEEIQKG